jgi:hypothetical protein
MGEAVILIKIFTLLDSPPTTIPSVEIPEGSCETISRLYVKLIP